MKTFLSNPLKKKQFFLVFIDCFIVVCAFMSSYAFRIVFYVGGDISSIIEKFRWLIVAAVFLHIIALYIFDLYNLEIKRTEGRKFVLIVLSVIIATAILALLSYMDPKNRLGRIVLVTHVPLTIILIFLWRKSFSVFFQEVRVANNLLLIGDSPLNEEITALLKKWPVKHYDLVGSINDYKENPEEIRINGIQSKKTIADIVAEQNIQNIVISKNLKGSPKLRNELLNMKFKGISIYETSEFYKKLTGKVPVFHVKDAWFIFHNNEGFFEISHRQKLKRIMDIVFSVMFLILAFPIFVVSFLAIKLSSPGPVFFRQERLGTDEKPYEVIKFRTMVMDAEQESGPKWSGRDDPRVTKLGRIMRKLRFDELPQLISILKGEMSFVGPRPIRKHFADILSEKIPFYRLRFLVKPGLTGWAQVKYDYAGSDEGQMEKLQYELFYIQNQTLIFDIYIILKTVQTVLFRRGV